MCVCVGGQCYSISFPSQCRGGGWGVCTGSGRQMPWLSCPADKEGLHNKCLREASVCKRWMGPRGRREKGGPQGRPNPPPAREAKAPEVMGPRTWGSFKALRSAESPSPTKLRHSYSLLSLLLQEGGRSVDLGTDSSLLLSGERAQHSLVSGWCGSVALSPFRSQAKCWYSPPTAPPRLCPWGRLPACSPG